MSRGFTCWIVGLAIALLAAAGRGSAQNLEGSDETALNGFAATPDELQAWTLATEGQHIRARELAEKILARDPRSFVAHLVLGYAQHFAEANLPRALYHLDTALALYEHRFGDRPGPEQ